MEQRNDKLSHLTSLSMTAKVDDPDFKEDVLSFITIKTILKDGENTGICHVKSNMEPKINTDYLLKIIRDLMPAYSSDLAFRGGKVEMEYPIYIAANDPIEVECVIVELKNVDRRLAKELSNKNFM